MLRSKHPEVVMRARWLFVSVLQVVGVLAGCGNCSDEVAAANEFLEEPANLACQSDEDCEVAFTGCAEPSRASCGQAPLNRAAASSQKWRRLSDALEECDDSCAQCDGLLTPRCLDGFCGGPP